MSSMNSRDAAVVVALLVPIVTAVVGALAIQFQDWRVNRSLAVQRRQAIEEASRQVGFVSEWWQASQLLLKDSEILKDVEARAVTWLEEAGRHAASAVAQPKPERQRATVRRLFLLQPLFRQSAKIIRIGFYAALVVVVGTTGSVVSDQLTSSAQHHIGLDLAESAFAGAVALGLRFWAVSVEAGSNSSDWPQVQPSRLLLLYPIHSRRVQLIRLGFYALSVTVLVLGWKYVPHLRHPSDVVKVGSFLVAGAVFAVCARLWAISLEAPPPPAQHQFGPFRRFFLFYNFERLGAQILRVFFYAFCLLSAVGVSTLFDSISTSDKAGIILFYGVPMLAVRFWAVHVEKARPRKVDSIQLPESRSGVAITHTPDSELAVD
jgi:hypothetical protein